MPVASPATLPPPPKVGVDMSIPLRAWWSIARVQRDGHGVFQARLSPANSAAQGQSRYVQMTGLGFPYVGSDGGHRYAGPGVDRRWESQDNEYEVSFRFTGRQLGLLVLSTGGEWRARVDG